MRQKKASTSGHTLWVWCGLFMSAPITPMRRPPSRHASVVMPVGETAVVCIRSTWNGRS